MYSYEHNKCVYMYMMYVYMLHHPLPILESMSKPNCLFCNSYYEIVVITKETKLSKRISYHSQRQEEEE